MFSCSTFVFDLCLSCSHQRVTVGPNVSRFLLIAVTELTDLMVGHVQFGSFNLSNPSYLKIRILEKDKPV